ncbi:hypothetical protein BJ944DRAFT_231920 [Cunninghamella echinulata]|nr:hypothetical protein BJ944DRAFT_231920 [Cunninghamella echinulata]
MNTYVPVLIKSTIKKRYYRNKKKLFKQTLHILTRKRPEWINITIYKYINIYSESIIFYYIINIHLCFTLKRLMLIFNQRGKLFIKVFIFANYIRGWSPWYIIDYRLISHALGYLKVDLYGWNISETT